jgi:serine/threonine-protein kinase
MPSADPLIGTTLANYRLERLLGRGGMASVYYGFDFQLQRPGAVKVIDDRHSGETSYSARFVREARAMASWRHPNIPQIYQAGVENGVYFYVMEYIHGMDLEELLRQTVQKGELLPFEDVLRYGKAVAEALDYAHLNGAIHRDVKPSNVLIAADGRIFLTDFGLVLEVAKGTQGEVFGSPLYIAPEQARNSADAVPQSDLYSLGVILYEMVVGRVPFEDPSSASLAIKHISLAPPPPRQLNPDLTSEVETVLLKALSKEPQERYQTGKELMAALEEGIGGQSSGVRLLPAVVPPPATLPFLPFDPQDQPQADNLQPGAGAGLPPGEIPQTPLPAAPQKRYIAAAIIAVSILATLCAIIMASFWLLGRSKTSSAVSTGQPSRTPLAVQSQSTPSPIPSATAEPSPTSTVSEIHLSLSMDDDDNIWVINQGNAEIPLAQLRFEVKKDKLSGDAWEIGILQPGQCVVILKQQSDSKPSSGRRCEVVGTVSTRNVPKKFWDKEFDVYFQNVLVDTCVLDDDDPCELQFSSSVP